ncbi:MAG: 50S ribosomal protein L21 [bacterium]|nr:50S ribosomal protein L21 [bacterium]
MYAVFQISGFQFNAEVGEVIQIPSQSVESGSKLDINEVLLLKKEDNLLIGQPFVEGARVEAEVVEHGKNEKVVVFKKKRRTKYRRTQGHRQGFSEIKINKIVAPEA